MAATGGEGTRGQRTFARIFCFLAGLGLTLFAALKIWLALVTGFTDFHVRHGGGTVIYTLAEQPTAYWTTIGGTGILVFVGLVLLFGALFGRGWRGGPR